MGRKFQGRKKIKIEKIQRKDYREIAFTKRRNGVFKKASELSTLCGAHTAIVVFSSSKKAYSFGDPCVNSVIENYLADKSPYDDQEVGDSSAVAQPSILCRHRSAYVSELNANVTELENQLDAEIKRSGALKQLEMSCKDQYHPWNSPVENLEVNELEQLRLSLENLKMEVYNISDEMLIGTSSLSSLMAANPDGMVNVFN